VGSDLWFSEAAGNRIGKITMDGVVTEYPAPSRDSGPRAIILGPDGNLWFVESIGNAIGRMDLRGNACAFPLSRPGASPRGIALSPSGEFWITENAANCVVRMTTTGEILAEYPLPTKQSGPRAIIVISDGRVFFSEYDAGQIGEIIPGEF
jgi:virginiamycin B lyase